LCEDFFSVAGLDKFEERTLTTSCSHLDIAKARGEHAMSTKKTIEPSRLKLLVLEVLWRSFLIACFDVAARIEMD